MKQTLSHGYREVHKQRDPNHNYRPIWCAGAGRGNGDHLVPTIARPVSVAVGLAVVIRLKATVVVMGCGTSVEVDVVMPGACLGGVMVEYGGGQSDRQCSKQRNRRETVRP